MHTPNLRPTMFARPLCSVLLLVVATCSGCKMMTDAQYQALQDQKKAEEQKSSLEGQNTERLAKVNKEKQQLQLRIQDRDARIARNDRFDEARTAFDGGNPEEALTIIEELLAKNEESVERYAAARAEGNTDDYLFDTVMVDDPKAATPGAQLEQQVVVPHAMEDTEKAMLFVLRGAVNYTLGNSAQGIADFEHATKLNPGNRVARINFGKLLFEQRQWEAALSAWRTELEEGYRSADLLELIGQALFELAKETGDPSLIEAARQSLLEAFVASPQKESLIRWLGNLEYHSERFTEAERYFRGILARHPLDPTYLEMLANTLLELERYREAADQFELLVRVSRGDDLHRVCLTLTGLYAQLRLPDRAAHWLRRAYEDRAMPSDARFDLVLYLSGAEQLEKALVEVEQIPRGADEYAEAQAIAAEMEITLRRFDAAADRLDSVLEVIPGDGQVRMTAGNLAMQRKQFDAAIRYYNLAAGIPDTKARGLAGAAEAYYELGNLAKAIDYYEDALEASPENAAFRAALGEIRTEHEFRQSVAKDSQP